MIHYTQEGWINSFWVYKCFHPGNFCADIYVFKLCMCTDILWIGVSSTDSPLNWRRRNHDNLCPYKSRHTSKIFDGAITSSIYMCVKSPEFRKFATCGRKLPQKIPKIVHHMFNAYFQQFSYKNDNSRSSKNLRKWKSVLLLHAKVFCPVTIDVQWLHKKSISRYTSAITS